MKWQTDKKYADYSSRIVEIPSEFDNSGETIHNKRNVVKIITGADGEPWVVKRFKRPNFIQRVVYSFFRKSKARRAFEYARYLLDNGISTPAPVAFMELKQGGLLNYCYFVSTLAQGESCWILNDDGADRGLAHAVAQCMVSLHEKGFIHGDPNLTNFLYKKREGGYDICVIDLNRSKIISNPSQEECLDNFMRVTHNPSAMQLIVGEYAKIRGWDEAHCIRHAKSCIKRLEKHERRKGRLKRIKSRLLKPGSQPR